MNALNKRRQAPFIYKTTYLNFNLTYRTLLTVEYNKEDIKVLKKHAYGTCLPTVSKRCLAIYEKMSNPRLSCGQIATHLGMSRNTVRHWINKYNNDGLKSVLSIGEIPGRPGKFTGKMDDIDKKLEKEVPKSSAETASIIETVVGIRPSRSMSRYIMRKLGYRFRKFQPIPGKADPEKQRIWLDGFQSFVNQAKEGKLRLFFMDAAHFTLEAFLCKVWSKQPLYLKGGAGRNRFNVIGCVDPINQEIISSHSMVYVNAEQVKEFLEKVRKQCGDIPVAIVLDNARYQHCDAVKEKARELGIELIFLPPYSPNLNIIERLWKHVRRHVLAGRHFDTPTKFHEALRCFFEDDYHNHKQGLSTLLTLKFQSFENAQIFCA